VTWKKKNDAWCKSKKGQRQSTEHTEVKRRHTPPFTQQPRDVVAEIHPEERILNDLSALLHRLSHDDAVLVQVEQVQGSAPREVGAWMAVFSHDTVGTIGGGHLEWTLMAHARAALRGDHPLESPQRHALGPRLGQCCGGVVQVALTRLTATHVPDVAQRLAPHRWPVALFGGGHVGQALVQALAPLPFALTWIDSRDEIFPVHVPDGVVCEHSAPVQAAVWDVVPHSAVLVMSFSHAEDLDIVAQCLLRQHQRQDLRWIGLIGSRTKWASFEHRLIERGFSEAQCTAITCPIGWPGIQGKQPAVIAASVAAQLLHVFGI
jgi:xanthine dehydrogenase accessory factor